MKKCGVIIVDDEALAREKLRVLLREYPDFEILMECKDGEKAIEAIKTLNPDLVFLDIKMPQVSGFDVVNAIGPESFPPVIFVTAYDAFALKAFEVHALDYLLKPFNRERLRKSLNHVRKRLDKERFMGALRDMRGPDHLLIREQGRVIFLPMERIVWIEAAGNYARIHTEEEALHLLRKTMAQMEGMLDPDRFIRIHRSTIVNIERIKEMRPLSANDFMVALNNGKELRMSRRYKPQFEKRFGKLL